MLHACSSHVKPLHPKIQKSLKFKASICSKRAAAPGRVPDSGSYPCISQTFSSGKGPSTEFCKASDSCHRHAFPVEMAAQFWVRGLLSEPCLLPSFAKSKVTVEVISRSPFNNASCNRCVFFTTVFMDVAGWKSGNWTWPMLRLLMETTFCRKVTLSIMYCVLLGHTVASTMPKTNLSCHGHSN